MNKEEIPIEYYLTKNGEVIKFVRYDELDKYKQVLNKIKDLLKEYKYTNVEDYSRIMEFYRKLDSLLEEIE